MEFVYHPSYYDKTVSDSFDAYLAKKQMREAMESMGRACLAVMEEDLCSDDCPFRLYCCQKIDEEPHLWETWEDFKKREKEENEEK